MAADTSITDHVRGLIAQRWFHKPYDQLADEEKQTTDSTADDVVASMDSFVCGNSETAFHLAQLSRPEQEGLARTFVENLPDAR